MLTKELNQMWSKVPLVSVLMTAYNREKYIAEAIESVLASSFQDFELIVVDDGSADQTVEIARKYETLDSRVRIYVNEKNLGDYPNRNRVASYARGKYLKYLDSDDFIYPHGLQAMVYSMEQFPQAGYGLSSHSDPLKPYPAVLTPKEAYLEHFGRFGHFDRAPGSSIIKREAFESVGGFSGERMIGDNRLWFTLSRYFSLVKMPRDLVWDRVHSGQESKSAYARQYDKLRYEVIKSSLQHEDCPLDKREINVVWRKYRREKYKSKIKEFLQNKLRG